MHINMILVWKNCLQILSSVKLYQNYNFVAKTMKCPNTKITLQLNHYKFEQKKNK